jgi:hypothetical protein
MMRMACMIVAMTSAAVHAQCNGAACPNPCDACAFDAVNGENPSTDDWRSLFVATAERRLADDTPAIATIATGAARERNAAPFPCRLMPAIAMTESRIAQFCDNGLTIISFDCGFGVMQVTSGAANYPGLEARTDINLGAGATILAGKWNSDDVFGGSFGDSDPEILESWYFAVWAYNGFIYGNNPNNPNLPANRPPFNGPGSLSRGSYPYPEIVWGYLRHPLEPDGAPFVPPVEVSYPTNIPNQSGLFSVSLDLPTTIHRDPCTENCPPAGCPPNNRRTIILDDADAGFTITGPNESHAAGGYDSGFRSAAPGSGDVVATWIASAPATGIFNLSGYIPLDPATNESMVVTVAGRGEGNSFILNQNVAGGFFASLGDVELREGSEFVITVTNNTDDTDEAHRLGFDAFRLTWTGDGTAAPGSACAATTDCAVDQVCVDGSCQAGCEQGCDGTCAASGLCTQTIAEGEGEPTGEGEGEAEPSEGEGDGSEGEGNEGEGEPTGPIIIVPPAASGCGCRSSNPGSSMVVMAMVWLRRLGRSSVRHTARSATA